MSKLRMSYVLIRSATTPDFEIDCKGESERIGGRDMRCLPIGDISCGLVHAVGVPLRLKFRQEL
jgi:hypothetical protein